MKHLQIKLTKAQSKFFSNIYKRYSWMKMTTKNDVVYFPEDNIVDVCMLVDNGGTDNSFRSLRTKLDKVIKTYDPLIQADIKESIETGKALQLIKLEKDLAILTKKEKEIKESDIKKNFNAKITEEKKEDGYKTVTMEVYEI